MKTTTWNCQTLSQCANWFKLTPLMKNVDLIPVYNQWVLCMLVCPIIDLILFNWNILQYLFQWSSWNAARWRWSEKWYTISHPLIIIILIMIDFQAWFAQYDLLCVICSTSYDKFVCSETACALAKTCFRIPYDQM